jgi:Fe/S biogenesis protein NfuA
MGALMVTVSELARKKILEVRQAEGRGAAGLRIIVRNGGTARVEYALHFVEPDGSLPGDTVHDAGGFQIHIDPDSAPYLGGATLDYVDGLVESGFKVEAPNAAPAPPSGPLAEAVQKVIDERINPAVASHGGWVALVGLDDDTAYLRLGGGCQGCGMVNVTLKQGIEVMIQEDVPQIRRVMDVTDHAGGKNPYYQPSK